MAGRKKYDDDDGRVIADMSDIEKMPLLIPRFENLDGRGKKERRDMKEPEPEREYGSDIRITKDERNALIRGTMAATLLVGGIFIAALALVLFLITRGI